MNENLPTDFIKQIESIVGKEGYTTNFDDFKHLLGKDGVTQILVKPASTTEVSETVQLCGKHNIGIVPLGGNTGLVGGAVPYGQILLSLERINKVREINPVNYTMVVDAGCILADVRKEADKYNLLFPLSMPAENESQIGGNIATNMGGVNFLQYGGARECISGLEVVLPNGDVWDGLRQLEKDNTGYDLKHLFVGSEGTLGIITGAVLKLRPRPCSVHSVLFAFNDIDNVLSLLTMARTDSGDNVTAFELMSLQGIDNVLKLKPELSKPMETNYEWYVLVEFSSSDPNSDLYEAAKAIAAKATEKGIVSEYLIAKCEEQADYLWDIRNSLPGTIYQAGNPIVFDTSVPVSQVPNFVKQATEIIRQKIPDALLVPFGHVGDGNIHYSLNLPKCYNEKEFLTKSIEITRLIHELITNMGGSISAEHGIGFLRKNELDKHLSDVEIGLMRKIKRAIDPDNIMNPEKVINI